MQVDPHDAEQAADARWAETLEREAALEFRQADAEQRAGREWAFGVRSAH